MPCGDQGKMSSSEISTAFLTPISKICNDTMIVTGMSRINVARGAIFNILVFDGFVF